MRTFHARALSHKKNLPIPRADSEQCQAKESSGPSKSHPVARLAVPGLALSGLALSGLAVARLIGSGQARADARSRADAESRAEGEPRIQAGVEPRAGADEKAGDDKNVASASVPIDEAEEPHLEHLRRLVDRVDPETGKTLDPPPRPEELIISGHRSRHPVDLPVRWLMGRVVRSTGSELKALRFLMRLRARARSSARTLSRALAMDDKRLARLLFGLEENKHFFRFRGPDHATERWQRQVGPLAAEARERLDGARAVAGDEPHLVLLLTGGTGFIGKEILWQAAANPSVAAVHAIIRPRTQKDRKTGEVRVVATSEQRGALLLDELGITDPEARSRFHFLTGDVEQSYFGLDPEELDRLARRVTHLVHCAASVSFDAPYEESYRANVVGTLRALELSRLLHRASGSPFVAHIGVETSYIHGRRLLAPAQEDTLGFPRNHYNNYYELTKAMASIETERFMVEEALPVIQLCPSIVIGEATTGNNRGDTKVVNAPVNLFGRMGEVLGKPKRGWQERSKVAVLARLSAIFPSDPSAQINLIPVDRVAAGVLASLSHPEAVGHRVHLANDRRITVREIVDIVDQELGVKVRLVEPNLHRNVGLPIVGRLLESLGGKAIVRSIGKMTDIFGGYAEWGQPVHQVGNDVRLLGLDPERPDPRQSFRMLCRHNRWVQRFGRIKSSEKLAERERSWSRFLGELELTQGASAADLSPGDFSRAAVEAGF